MLGTLEYWMGKMPAGRFFPLLGSMSYTEGRPTPQSDPRRAPEAPPVPEPPGAPSPGDGDRA